MVVLAASVLTKKGQVLLSRQFVTMTRSRVQNLLSTFSVLVEKEESMNVTRKQHTFIQSDDVRYIYQTMDAFYLLLITNTQSNIVEDFVTLRSIAKLLPDCCKGRTVNAVKDNVFDLVFLIDEVVGFGGNQEQTDEKQIKEYTKMNSQEAVLAYLSEQQSMKRAVKIAQQKALQLEQERQRKQHLNKMKALQGMSLGDFKSSSHGQRTPETQHTHPSVTGHDVMPKKTKKHTDRSGWLKLQSKKNDDLINQLTEVDKMLGKLDSSNRVSSHLDNKQPCGNSNTEPSNSVDAYGRGAPVQFGIRETLSVSLDTDGSLRNFEVKGDLDVTVFDPEATSIIIQLDRVQAVPGFHQTKWRPHPHLKKSEFEKNLVVLKDQSKVLKLGKDHKTTVVKWKLSSRQEEMVPINLTYWPESDAYGNDVNVSVSFTVDKENVLMKNVCVMLPVPDGSQLDVEEHDDKYSYSHHSNGLKWKLEDLSTGDEGQISYTLKNANMKDLFPVNMEFQMEPTFSGIKVEKVFQRKTDDNIDFSCFSMCRASLKYGMMI